MLKPECVAQPKRTTILLSKTFSYQKIIKFWRFSSKRFFLLQIETKATPDYCIVEGKISYNLNNYYLSKSFLYKILTSGITYIQETSLEKLIMVLQLLLQIVFQAINSKKRSAINRLFKLT